jgi:hypothetical protein
MVSPNPYYEINMHELRAWLVAKGEAVAGRTCNSDECVIAEFILSKEQEDGATKVVTDGFNVFIFRRNPDYWEDRFVLRDRVRTFIYAFDRSGPMDTPVSGNTAAAILDRLISH